MVLQAIWFALVGVLLAGYAVLDGFDLGVGILYPFVTRSRRDRAILRASVGPVWDGNEVWLLAAAGALFAAFPPVYATVFSGFYLALAVVLLALILRAVSFEFHAHDEAWRGLWDVTLFAGSLLPALLFGVAAGNIVRGVPLGAGGEFAGAFFTLLNPYALLCGVVGLVFFIQHGASWLAIKTHGDLRERVVAIRDTGQWAYTGLLGALALTTLLALPQRFAAAGASPAGWLGIVLTWGGVAAAIFFASQEADVMSLLGSSASIIGLVALWAAGIFPYLVPGLGTAGGLSAFSSSSSQLTLGVMLAITLVGLPIVLAYTVVVYRVFSGKALLDPEGSRKAL